MVVGSRSSVCGGPGCTHAVLLFFAVYFFLCVVVVSCVVPQEKDYEGKDRVTAEGMVWKKLGEE